MLRSRLLRPTVWWPVVLALCGLLSSRASAGTTQEVATRAITARFLVATTSPPNWQTRTFDDRTWSESTGPLVPRSASESLPPGVTAIDVVPGSFLYTRVHFDVDMPERARSLELRIGYQDGFIAYLNGREVARRGVPLVPLGARPALPHGGEIEHIYLRLPQQPGPASLARRNNVLAVEIRPAIGRSAAGSSSAARAPAGEISAAVFSDLRIVRGPYLLAPREGAVSVAWETDLAARGSLRYEPETGSPAEARSVVASRLSTRQVVSLSHLGNGRRYRYRVEVKDAAGAVGAASATGSFQAAPGPHQPLRFIVYGDMRAPGHAAHQQVVDAILRETPALVVNTGDLVAVGSEESAWQRYFEITASLGAVAPVVPALGNHESYLGGAAKSWALFGLRSAAPASASGDGSYTSFDWGGAHFIILDSNQPQGPQRDWLARDLAAARTRNPRGIFAFCHDGPWSHGTHGGAPIMERDFAPLLARGGVDVLFSGHDHLYERGIGVTPRGPLPYVVTGGGGAPLYTPTCQPLASPSGPTSGPTPNGTAAAPGAALQLSMPPCPSSVATIRKTHHYVVVEVSAGQLTICPRQPDGTPVEPCVRTPLRAASAVRP